MKIIWTNIFRFLDFLILKNFSRILEKLHFSISRHFHFTFHSRSRSWAIFISLFILEMSEPDFHFTFHFSKWVSQIFFSLLKLSISTLEEATAHLSHPSSVTGNHCISIFDARREGRQWVLCCNLEQIINISSKWLNKKQFFFLWFLPWCDAYNILIQMNIQIDIYKKNRYKRISEYIWITNDTKEYLYWKIFEYICIKFLILGFRFNVRWWVLFLWYNRKLNIVDTTKGK